MACFRCPCARVAGLYDATRRGYPAEIVSTIFSTAAIGPGASVMEIGRGTDQFTRQLAGRALDVTAIDIGAAMVATARRNVADPRARFQVCSFEDFTGSGPFDLAVVATHTRALQLPAQTVMGVERTRATFLSCSQQDQGSFTADLGTLIQPATRIDLAQETFLAMAPSTA